VSASADVSRFLAGIEQKKAAAIAAATRALDQFGEQVIGDAQQLTPVDTGFLKASGTTLPAELHDGRITKVIGFSAGYALAVHERLERKGPSLADRQGKAAGRLAKVAGQLKAHKKTIRAGVKAGREQTAKSHLTEERLTAAKKRAVKHVKTLGKKRQGQPKFLETAIRQNAPKLAPFVMDQVRAAIA
jgi:hypothetical protein